MTGRVRIGSVFGTVCSVVQIDILNLFGCSVIHGMLLGGCHSHELHKKCIDFQNVVYVGVCYSDFEGRGRRSMIEVGFISTHSYIFYIKTFI